MIQYFWVPWLQIYFFKKWNQKSTSKPKIWNSWIYEIDLKVQFSLWIVLNRWVKIWTILILKIWSKIFKNFKSLILNFWRNIYPFLRKRTCTIHKPCNHMLSVAHWNYKILLSDSGIIEIMGFESWECVLMSVRL